MAALALAAALAAGRARADCVDPVEQKKLIDSKRVTRAAVDRDFVKAGRHEISVMGGYYVSDLFDGTFVLTGAYTYHLTEDVGVEASFGWSRVHSSVAAKLEADHSVTVLPAQDRVFLIFANAVYAPLHGKAQIFSDTILHFDLYGSLGVGLIDNSTSAGAAGQGGVGIKMFVGKAFAFRLDARDQVYRQQVLGNRQYVSDFQVTLGVSLFLPPSP